MEPQSSPSITITADVASLLGTLGISQIGSGQLHAHVNGLIAMCSTLVALEGPGDHLVDSDTSAPLPTGIHLIASDPATVRMIRERIVTPLQDDQNRVLVNVNRVNRARQKEQRLLDKHGISSLSQLECAKENANRAPHMYLDPLKLESNDLFERNPTVAKDQVYSHPRFAAFGTGPTTLAIEISQAHDRHLMVCPVFNRVEQVDGLDGMLNELISGNALTNSPNGEFGSPVRGTLLVTVTTPIASAIANPCLVAATFPNRCLWLPTALSTPLLKLPPARIRLLPSFQRAVRTVLESRLRHGKRQPAQEEQLRSLQAKFLKAVRSTPGIDPEYVEASASLFPTLWRGLHLLTARSLPAGTLDSNAIVELAIFVVRQSWKQVAAARAHGTQIIQQRIDNEVLARLSDEPMSVRDLYRSFHSMRRMTCVEALERLEQQGLARCLDGKWIAVEPAANGPEVIEA